MMKKLFNLALVLLVTASVFAEEVKIDGLWYEIIAKAKEAIVIKKNYEKYGRSGDFPWIVHTIFHTA